MLARFGLSKAVVESGSQIPGSYWGDSEAGLVANRIYLRADTPVHSLLHELAHVVCMDSSRRSGLETDAGSDDAEECAVCYLEILLADHVPPFDRRRCLADMDTWGYSFREGSAGAWFENDGRDARDWLIGHGLIDARGCVTWRIRK